MDKSDGQFRGTADMDFREITEDEIKGGSGQEKETLAERGQETGEDEKKSGHDGEQDSEYEELCYMCRRPESKTGKLMSLPGGLHICSDCMQRAFESFENSGLQYSDLLRMTVLPPGMDLQSLEMMQVPKKQKLKKKKEKDKEKTEPEFDLKAIPLPHQIKARLDEYVVGQESAKKVISVAVYNHYKRVIADPSDGVEIEKSNILMIGPTGSGKTFLVKTLAKLLDVPLAIADATSLTEAGYIGDDIESVVSKLLAAADNDVDRAEHGIIFIDEIDKIAKKKNTNTRDVSGESVQQELLKLLEGSNVEVPVGGSSKNMMVPMATVNTNHILFICGGAFPDLEDIIRERLNKKSSIGFGSALKLAEGERENLLQEAAVEDLRKFGMIPEFLGRLPMIVTLEALTAEYLVRILTEPKNAIVKQYQKLLRMDEVDLIFEEDALTEIARTALEKKTGARALRAIIEGFMQDIMYEVPKDSNIGSVTITKDYIEKKGGPVIGFRGLSAMNLIP